MLEIGKKLKKELQNRGYQVLLSRESQAVNISNIERSLWANKNNCDAYIRLHADSSNDKNKNGVSVLTSSKNNIFVKNLFEENYSLSEKILQNYVNETGLINNGISYRDDLSGTNWAKIPNTLIELGFLSNKIEDKKLNENNFQEKIIRGIASGIDEYF